MTKHTDTDELRVRELIRYRVTQEYQKYHNEAGFKYSGKEFWVDQIVWKLGEALEEIITAYTTNRERALLDELEEAIDSDELLEFLKSKRELQNQTSKTECELGCKGAGEHTHPDQVTSKTERS